MSKISLKEKKDIPSSLFGKIQAPDAHIYARIKRNWDNIAKPLDGMGRFEEFHARIGAIQEREQPDVMHGAVLVFCADNGIVEEGVSQSGQEVTRACAVNMGKGCTAVGAMAKAAGVRVVPVDIGIASETGNDGRKTVTESAGRDSEIGSIRDVREADFGEKKPEAGTVLKREEGKKEKQREDRIPGVINRKVAFGTRNFLKEPAMTPQETRQAIETGIRLVADLRQEGVSILGLGELGIGNTTTSACVAAALLGCDPALAVGRGAGLSDNGLQRKKEVVEKALAKWGFLRDSSVCDGQRGTAPNPGKVLQTVGGLDIAGMCGACIGGAKYHVPIVLDGVISMTAALVAQRLVPGVRDFLIPSHLSREPAASLIADELKLSPVLDADMALGEGTGAVMMLSLLKLADNVYRHCVRFDDSGVEAYQRYDT